MTGSVRRVLGPAVRGAASGAITAMLVGGVLLAGAPAQAAQAPASCSHPSLNQQIKQADVVFRGAVEKVRPVKGKGTARTRNYRVQADRVYQSSLVTDSVIVTAAVGTKCPPPPLAHGKRYIFFVTENGSQLLATPATAKATKKLDRQLVAKLGSPAQPQKTPPVAAEFTKVAGAAPPRLSRLLAPGAALVIVSLLGLLVAGRLGRRPT